jgi:rare lipoprotein A
MISKRSTIGLPAAALSAALAFAAPAAHADMGFSDIPALQEAQQLADQPAVAEPRGMHPPIDHSGRKQAGKASFYGHEFAGKKMANGRRFNPKANVAASKSLPLGTVAKVTNLHNGRSAMVRVEDRGPYVAGRVVDLTPQTAAQLGMTHEGVAPVVVAPVAVPQPDGQVKPGAGAVEVPPPAAAQALKEARDSTPPMREEASR